MDHGVWLGQFRVCTAEGEQAHQQDHHARGGDERPQDHGRKDGRPCGGAGRGLLRGQLQLGPKLGIVGRLLFRLQQAQLGRSHLVEQLLRQGTVRAGLEGAQMGHLPICRALDHVGVGLEPLDAQQAVVVGRLILGRNAQPLVIRVQGRVGRLLFHGLYSYSP